MKRSSPLPVIEIGDLLFRVDIKNDCLFVKGDRDRMIRFEDLKYEGIGYLVTEELFPGIFPGEYPWEYIPDKIKLDPEGVSLKYNIPVEQLVGKRDFEALVDQELYQYRNGRLPVIDICGDKFFVDIRVDEMRLTSDPFKKIPLSYYQDDLETMQYQFYYDKDLKEAVQPDYLMTEYPKNIVWVEIPRPEILDPLAFARMNEKDIKSFLISHPISKTELKAKEVPLSKTELAAVVKDNKAAEKKAKEEFLMKKKRDSNRKGRGPRLY